MQTSQSLIVRYLLILALLVVGAVVVKHVVLGGLPVLRLAPAPPLSNTLSQGLTASLGSNGTLPVEGKDYTIKNVHYFDNRAFVVVTVDALKISTDPGVLVLQKLSGSYRVILGPGTNFSSNSVQSLPVNVVQYLNNQGLIYESE